MYPKWISNCVHLHRKLHKRVSFMKLFLLFFGVISVCQSTSETEGPSFMVEPPSKVQFSNSTGAIVQCSVSGRPTPNVTWRTEDGEVVNEVDGLRRVRADGSLVFSPFPAPHFRDGIHSATYSCVATNIIGILISRDVHVSAVVSQHYEVRLSEEFVIRENTAVLRCPIPSYVSDHVRVKFWQRSDGFMITPDIPSGKYGFLDNGDLYVLDTNESDSEKSFTCHTEDTITGEQKASLNKARIIITDPPSSQSPRIIRRSNTITVSANQRAVLSCIAQGHPRPAYRWLRRIGHHLTILDYGVRVHSEGGVLVFHRALPSDSGQYTCHVSNSVGDDRADLEIHVREPLSVSVSPSVVEADIGDSVEFRCALSSGVTDARVSWLKNVRTVFPDHRNIVLQSPSVLRLVHVRREDEGVFQCFARVESESSQASARLVISDVAPELKSTFTKKTVAAGTFVSLSCTASGKPAPDIQWTMDNGYHLSNRAGLNIRGAAGESGQIISTLNFTSVDVSDSGVYTCTSTNGAGSDRHSERLNVFGPLFVRETNRNLTTLAGSNLTIVCPFGGYPFDTVIWRKDGRLLPVNQHQRVHANGTLTVQNVQQDQDDGPYTCQVSARQNSMPASGTVNVVIRTGPRVSPFDFRSDLHEGMRTAVTCVVTAGDTPYTIRWTKDGLPLRDGFLDAAIHYPENGFVSTLSIDRLAYRHNGRYSCLATNDVATGSYTAVLTVKVPPRWVVEPSDVSTVSGRPARIDCQADGVPQPHVRWKKARRKSAEDFQTIVSSSHVHTLVNGSLNFQKIESSDAGYYLCEANNGIGAGLNHVIRLTVHSAPEVTTRISEITARRGQRAQLTCNVKGERPVEIRWSKNGQPLDPIDTESRYPQETEDLAEEEFTTKVIIHKAERQDTAHFTCSADNEYGEDSANIQLIVQDIPDAPQNVEVHEVSSRSVRLTWKAPFDGNSPITEYTVAWRQLEGESVEDPQKIPGGETTHTLRGLHSATRYFFGVRCANALGSSQYSAEVAATTLQEPPNYAPNIVQAVPLSSTAINVTWKILMDDESKTNIQGYHVGCKARNSLKSFALLSVPFEPLDLSGQQSVALSDLSRSTEYLVVIRAYNDRGSGPPSQEVNVKTLEFDPPLTPKLKLHSSAPKSIRVSWEMQQMPEAPVSGCILYYRTEDSEWLEARILENKSGYTFQNLRCGTTYYIFLVAYNNVGRSNSTDILTTKTTGNAPIAPEKRSFLFVNSTSLTVRLDRWMDGGCSILSFGLWYRKVKSSGQEDYALLDSSQKTGNVTATGLDPGTWYNLKMVATNDAGSTEAEYDFATLTLTGEFPPVPTEMRGGGNDVMYRHLTVTLPLVSLALLLVAVALSAGFLVNRRRFSSRRHNNPDGAESSGSSKRDLPLSVTYEGTQDPNYFPAAYSTGHIYQRNYMYRERTTEQQQCLQKLNMEGMDGVCTEVLSEHRQESNYRHLYEAPATHGLVYHQRGSGNEKQQAIYEVPDRGRKSLLALRESTEGSSAESTTNDDDRSYSWHRKDDLRDDCRHSETECDRLWKAFAEKQFEGRRRDSSHVILS